MLKISGNRVYLAVLEREHCKKLWDDFEYDFDALTEPLNNGHSNTKSDKWFDEIQKLSISSEYGSFGTSYNKILQFILHE